MPPSLFAPFPLLYNRDDAGKLWENFLIVERMKLLEYKKEIYAHYFWRLTSGAELDLVEETKGTISGFELKYSTKIPRLPHSWTSTYPNATASVINRDNWQEFTVKE